MSLQVIMSENGQQAEGVLIPLKDWKLLEPFIDKKSELYSLMERLVQKPPFEMSQDEFREHVRPVASDAKLKARNLGLPDIYKNEHCHGDDQFIREYANGTKELVSINIDTRTFTILKTF